MITADMIDDAIAKCVCKTALYGIDMCTWTGTPCLMTVDNGECVVIKELIQKNKETKI